MCFKSSSEYQWSLPPCFCLSGIKSSWIWNWGDVKLELPLFLEFENEVTHEGEQGSAKPRDGETESGTLSLCLIIKLRPTPGIFYYVISKPESFELVDLQTVCSTGNSSTEGAVPRWRDFLKWWKSLCKIARKTKQNVPLNFT